jgi:hypothetical protein
MAEDRPATKSLLMSRVAFAALTAVVTACAAGVGQFPHRAPLWKDPDDAPFTRQPVAYRSSYAWDVFDNLLFRPLARFFAVDPAGEAVNVNSLDEVPDSSWFTNRIGRAPISREELVDGACAGTPPLDPDPPDGTWEIDFGKPEGSSAGFRVVVGGVRYMLKADEVGHGDRSTGAQVLATRAFWAAGWNTTCEQLVSIRPSALRLDPGLVAHDNQGNSWRFDEKALAGLLARAVHDGDRVRLVASRWLPGRTLGPFRYVGTRPDDPNDVVRHEDRRDLRGARIFAAWLNHWDAREENTMDVWMPEPDGRGHVVHFLFDMNDCLGAQWGYGFEARTGSATYIDVPTIFADWFTFGLITRPWDRIGKLPFEKQFGSFRADGFDPASWVPGYPNPAFERMTERDGAWAARVLARFTDEDVDTLVSTGAFGERGASRWLARTLDQRRDAILRRYFTVLSPIADVVVDGDRLCGVDLARRVFDPSRFRYTASTSHGDRLAVVVDGDRVCVQLPATDGYVTINLANGQSAHPLRAHLWGHDLAAVERP